MEVEKDRRRPLLLIGLLVALMMTAITWLTIASQKKPVLVIAGFDKSGSVPQDRQTDHCNLLERFTDTHSGRILLFEFGRKTELLYDDDLDETAAFRVALDEEIKLKPARKEWGTYFAPILQAMTHKIEEEIELPAIGFLLTDGGCDDRLDTREAARVLAGSRLKVLVIGPVLPRFRLGLEDLLAPLKVAGKLVLCTGNDTEGALRSAERKLEKK